jgi:hypothetical protein
MPGTTGRNRGPGQKEDTMIRKTPLRAALAAAVGATLLSLPATAQQLTLMTGPQGGVWVPIGGALKSMWEKAIPGLNITSVPGAGIANVRGVDEGKAHIGFGNSSTTVDGLQGNPPYPKKVTKVCQLANLYPQYFQVVALADAKVASYADLKGKSVVTQPKGNTAELLTDVILKLNGLNYQALSKINFQSYTDGVSLMKDGHAQVFTLGTTIPASSVMDLASARDIQLVPVDDKTMDALRKTNPGYQRLIVKAGTYPKQDKDVPQIGYSAHLVVSCDLPDDMVYTMLKTLAANVDSLASINKPMGGLTPKDMAEDIGVPFHKGAVRFYKEAKAM